MKYPNPHSITDPNPNPGPNPNSDPNPDPNPNPNTPDPNPHPSPDPNPDPNPDPDPPSVPHLAEDGSEAPLDAVYSILRDELLALEGPLLSKEDLLLFIAYFDTNWMDNRIEWNLFDSDDHR